MVFSPASHPPVGLWVRLYDVNDGGIAFTDDRGTTFSNALQGVFPNALATNLFRAMDIGRGTITNNSFSYGGQQDTGTVGGLHLQIIPGISASTVTAVQSPSNRRIPLKRSAQTTAASF